MLAERGWKTGLDMVVTRSFTINGNVETNNQISAI
jgi:hypothetical protein